MVGKPEERGPLGIPRRRWKKNIKTDLQEVEWGMEWIWLSIGTGGSIVNAVMNIWIP
jgi:hypothetical protein